jgi:hypothetical protein
MLPRAAADPNGETRMSSEYLIDPAKGPQWKVSGVGYARTAPWLLQPGDVVEVERLGVLTDRVVDNSSRRG